MELIGCTIKRLPEDMMVAAAETAVANNPANRPNIHNLFTLMRAVLGTDAEIIPPQHIALVTTKYWGAGGVKLTVGFPFDSPAADLKARILSHMNAWNAKGANVEFVLSNTDPQVRIARTPGQGYWSYLGTDILHIPRNQPTMTLDSFTMNTPESEFIRVVRHETGHTLGAPHEHMRQELVQRLDRAKTIAYFQQTQGWSPQETMQQVLTPIPESQLMASPHADQDSIMTYQLPPQITIDNQGIRGGLDINGTDYSKMGDWFPKVTQPNPPVPPVKPPTEGDSMWTKLLALWNAIKSKDFFTAIKILIDLYNSASATPVGAQATPGIDEVTAELTKLAEKEVAPKC